VGLMPKILGATGVEIRDKIYNILRHKYELRVYKILSDKIPLIEASI
jgi:hypothetical protein